MMNITFRLIDRDRKGLSDAIHLRVIFPSRRGGESLNQLLDVKRGVARMEIADREARAVDFAAGKYVVQLASFETFPANLQGKPEKTAGGLDAVLMVAALPTKKPDEPVASEKLAITFALKTEKGRALVGAKVALRAGSEEVGAYETDKLGNIDLTMTPERLEQFLTRDLELVARTGERELVSIKRDGPAQEGQRLRFVWTMSEVAPTPSAPDPDVILPGPPSTPERQPEIKPPRPSAQRAEVRGRVLDRKNQPVAKRRMRAVHVEIGTEILLGEDETDAAGRYAISYDLAQLPDGRKAADLVVHMLDGQKKPALSSALIAKARLREVVNFALGGTPGQAPTLFDRIELALEDAGAMGKLAELTDRDGALIAARSGEDAGDLATYLAAARLLGAQTANAPAARAALAALFGWIHSGLPADLTEIVARSDKVLANILRAAIEKRVIPEIDLKKAIAALRETGATAPVGALSIIERLLVLAGLKPDPAPAIAGVLASDAEGDAQWQKVAGIIGKAPAEKFRDIVAIWQLIDKNIALTEGIVADRKIAKPRRLAVLSESDIAELIAARQALPEHWPGASAKARTLAYAEFIARRIEARFAHASFVERLRRADTGKSRDLGDRLAKQPALDFALPQPAGGEAADLAKARSLFLVGPEFRRGDTADILLTGGIAEARDIVEQGRARFRDGFAVPLGGQRPADQVFDRAKALAGAVAAHHAGQLARGDEAETPKTLRGQLFNGAVSTACPHCASLLSPGAYLVDLFAFVSLAQTDKAGKNGREVLAARRPDLEGTEVTCANADIVQPYINLVLEVLEDQIAPWSGPPRQTTQTTEALRVWPEHVNMAAYDALQQRTFPWVLPFGRAFTAAGAMLAGAGTSLHLLRWATGEEVGSLPYSAARLGVFDPARLGLPEQEGRVAETYGFANFSKLVEAAATLGSLATHLQIAPDDLLALIQTGFVTGGASGFVQADGTLSQAAKQPDVLARLQLVGRIWRQTGLDIAEIDAMLGILGAPSPTPRADWLAAFADLKELAESLAIPAQTIAGLLALPPAERDRSCAQLFGLAVEDVAWLRRGGIDTGRVSGLKALGAAVEELRACGLSVADAEALLSVPQVGETFAPDRAAIVLEELQAAFTLDDREADPDTGLTALGALIAEVAATTGDANSDPLAESRQALGEALASAFGVTAERATACVADATDSLLWRVLGRGQALTAEELAGLWKTLAFCDATGLGYADARGAAALAPRLGWTDPQALPVAQSAQPGDLEGLLTLARYLAPGQAHFGTPGAMLTWLAGLESDLAGAAAELAALTDWAEADIAAALGADGLAIATRNAFFTRHAALRLFALLALGADLKTEPATLFALAKAENAELARDTVAATVAEADWPDVGAKIVAPVLEASRDALLGRIIATQKAYGSSLDVFNTLLIDVDMSACYMTSRIKQAAASVQQFVQRITLDLEGSLALSEELAREWAWRKNYRVWEANRKVFFFPENWLEPELRDNKTELYQRLESSLLQGEISADTAETALLEYARGLHAISSLEPAGLLEDTDAGVTHVFARSRETPHIYYRCARAANGTWSGWSQIEVDIEGDHFLPVIYNGRLFLFWASLEAKVDSENESFVRQLASLEADLEDATSTLNNAKRSLDELNTKLAEAQAKVDNNEDPFGIYDMLTGMYQQIIDNSEAALGDMVELITDKKQAISDLNLAYTYLDVSLSWTQHHRLTGWSQVRRSKSAISTRISYRGALKHWRYPEGVFLRRVVAGDSLRIELRSDRATPDHVGGYTRDNTYHYGDFVFDVVNEALVIVENAAAPDQDYLPAAAYLFARQANAFVRRYDPVDFRRVTDEETYVSLLYGRDHLGSARAVPATRHYDAPDQAAMLLGVERRNYLVEPTTRLPLHQKLTPALDGKAALAAPKARGVAARSDLAASAREPAGIMVYEAPDEPQVMSSAPAQPAPATSVAALDPVTTWRFTGLHYPFSDIAITALYRDGLDGLFAPDLGSGTAEADALKRQHERRDYFDRDLNASDHVNPDFPVDEFTFDRKKPFAVYNWELFFHAPYAIAKDLSRNRRFEEAQRWFHFIFNPIQKDGPKNASVWRLRPFWEVHKLLQTGNYDALTELDAAALDAQAAEWLANPFNPHAVARLRSLAYMRATFMAYLDNLIAWADDLFSRDTMESLAEASQLYVLVAQLLGARPLTLPQLGSDAAKSVAEMLDGNDWGTVIPGGIGGKLPGGDPVAVSPLFARFGQLCMPSNDRLLEYWATVEDRLFKIRHCMNIDGVVRKLPLYQPPIDPALLVRAAASGLSIADAVSGLSARLPHYRFTYMQAKALEFAGDVRALGAALLSALEKKDAEALAQLRADHEATTAERMVDIRKDRIAEAEAAVAAGEHALISATHTQAFYVTQIERGLLGAEKDEQSELTKAHRRGQEAQVASMIGGALGLIPQIGFDGPMPLAHFGGIQMAAAANAIAQGLTFAASQNSFNAAKHARAAQNTRRAEDWHLRKNIADRDVARAEKDLIAAEIRLEVARKELADQERQRTHSAATAAFLHDKFTNAALYGWMVGELSRLHYQSYALAVELARGAQACFQNELDKPDATFVQFGHFDSLRKGLLAGERLTLDLRRMESAYLAENRRGPEMRKAISLARLNPAALLQLRQGQAAQFSLPEFLFDLDAPGHYNRRIKSVSLTIPALVGPQDGVPCELRLKSSFLRNEADLAADPVPAAGGQTITASGAQSDAGMFQVDFRDERYLPFEGAGVISSWELRLPDADLAQFDYASITDVVLNIAYTAKAGPDSFRTQVANQTRDQLGSAIDAFGETFAPAQLLSLRYDFPIVWAQIRETGPAVISLDLSANRFPYLFAGRSIGLDQVAFHLPDGASATEDLPGGAPGPTLVPLPGAVAAAVAVDAKDVLMVLSYSVS